MGFDVRGLRRRDGRLSLGLIMNDRDFDPPEPCERCGEYHAMKNGLCWECLEEDKAEAAERKGDEMRHRRIFGED